MNVLILILPFLHVVSSAVIPTFPSCAGLPVSTRDYVNHADVLMRNYAMPFWHSKVDFDRGGYNIVQGTRSLVEQARMVWLFSTAMMNGYDNENPTNRQSADAGVDFLLTHFLDKTYGGYYWSTDEEGNAIDSRKFAYGQAFAMYTLSRYVRATGDPRAMDAAMEMFRTFQLKSQENPGNIEGWLEHYTRDWTPMTSGHGPMGSYEGTSADFALHIMESLSELFQATGHPDVRSVLLYVLTVYVPKYYPQNPAEAVSIYDLQGSSARTGAYDYGHLIEYAWLRLEADKAVGGYPDWNLFHRYMDYVVAGLNSESKGVPTSTFLEWWPQTELLAAISVAKQAGREVPYKDTMKDLLDLIYCKFIDPNSGISYYALNFDGSVRDGGLASKWKLGYHDSRGFLKFISAFQSQ